MDIRSWTGKRDGLKMVEKILDAVKAAGVVGAGGAGFPTHVKIKAPAELVIANGAECEPLLHTNEQLMITRAKDILAGLKFVMKATGALKGIIGIKQKHQEAVEALQTAIQHDGGKKIQLFFLPDVYPAGDEQVLVYEVTGRIVPEGGIPLQVGVVVSNVETLLNVAQAIEEKPVTEKYVTVTGAVHCPVTLKVPIGVSIQEMIAAAGGATVTNYRVIDGGPMMGKIVSETDPVTKTTGGLIVLATTHSLIRHKTIPWKTILNRAKAVCCNCRACTESCPRHLLGHRLEPHRIMQAVGSGVQNSEVLMNAFLCSECGVCDTFGCTMGLSPRRVNHEIKQILGTAGIKNPNHNKPANVRRHREYHCVPTTRILHRLGLSKFDVPAPLKLEQIIQPKEVKLLLSQHIGAPAMPLVKTGDIVTAGQLIAAIPEKAAVGANLHASISGTVKVIDKAIVIHAS